MGSWIVRRPNGAGHGGADGRFVLAAGGEPARIAVGGSARVVCAGGLGVVAVALQRIGRFAYNGYDRRWTTPIRFFLKSAAVALPRASRRHSLHLSPGAGIVDCLSPLPDSPHDLSSHPL